MDTSILFLTGTINPETDLGKSFQKIVDSMFTRYRGVMIQEMDYGFKVFGKVYKTIKEAKVVVDASYDSLKNSIK